VNAPWETVIIAMARPPSETNLAERLISQTLASRRELYAFLSHCQSIVVNTNL
jgi:hypothetical protein